MEEIPGTICAGPCSFCVYFSPAKLVKFTAVCAGINVLGPTSYPLVVVLQ